MLYLLLQYDNLFNGALDTIYTQPVHRDLNKDTVPKHHKASQLQ